MSHPGRAALLLIAAALLCGCPGGDKCVQVNTDCSPIYEPVYDNIFTNTFEAKCGIGGVACHAREGHMNGLIFEDPDEAYDLLLGNDGRARLIPGDPGCSLIVRRLESDNPDFQMPPGSPLPPGERCVIEQWIANGAER